MGSSHSRSKDGSSGRDRPSIGLARPHETAAAEIGADALAVVARGIRGGGGVYRLMLAIAKDVVNGKINTKSASVLCTAAARVQKQVEMSAKWGIPAIQKIERQLAKSD